MANKGDRVELIHCNDPYTRLTPGERGTVAFVDDLGTVHVKWDSGSSLGLCREDGDAWTVVDKATSLRPRPGESPEETVNRAVEAVREGT